MREVSVYFGTMKEMFVNGAREPEIPGVQNSSPRSIYTFSLKLNWVPNDRTVPHRNAVNVCH